MKTLNQDNPYEYKLERGHRFTLREKRLVLSGKSSEPQVTRWAERPGWNAVKTRYTAKSQGKWEGHSLWGKDEELQHDGCLSSSGSTFPQR